MKCLGFIGIINTSYDVYKTSEFEELHDFLLLHNFKIFPSGIKFYARYEKLETKLNAGNNDVDLCLNLDSMRFICEQLDKSIKWQKVEETYMEIAYTNCNFSEMNLPIKETEQNKEYFAQYFPAIADFALQANNLCDILLKHLEKADLQLAG